MNVAEYICQYLAKYDVKNIYGHPGGSIVPLLNAIHRHPKLKWILLRHEFSAALAASAQAKLTGKLSVCMASTGPGAVNLITGLLDADADRAPVLAITGLIPTHKQGLMYFQDIDHVTIFKSICGLSLVCEHPDQVGQLLQNAIGYILKNRRVAHIAIASDVQRAIFNESHKHKHLQRRIELMKPPNSALEVTAHTINESSDIIIAVGPRAKSSGKEIEKLATKLDAPIVSSFAGKGCINENHPNYFGVLGLYGSPANQLAMRTIKKAKMVLAFGIDDLVYFLTESEVDQKRLLIECEPDVTTLTHAFIQTRVLLGDLSKIAGSLAKLVKPVSSKLLTYAMQEREKSKKIKSMTHAKAHTVHQQVFFEKLNKYIDKPKTILAFDIGDNAVWSSIYLNLTRYQKTLVSNRVGTMGFCLPAVIAAKLSNPDHQVIGITGDGGLQMVLSELNSCAQLHLNVIIIVINNGVLQRVIAQKEDAYGNRLKNPDYDLLAKACGMACFTLSEEKQIDDVLAQAFKMKNQSVLINVICDPAIFAPMTNWV